MHRLTPHGRRGDDGPDDETAAKRGFTFTAATLITLFVAALLAQLPGIGWRNPTAGVEASAFLWPTRWRFYADAARQEYVVAYRLDGKHRFHRLTQPIADRENRWGLGSSGYAELIRLLDTAAEVPPDAWRPCAAERIDACAGIVASAPVTTIAARPGALSGPVVVAVEQPADRSEGATRRIVRVAVLNLTPPG